MVFKNNVEMRIVMEKVRLFRKRLLPDEMVELKDDTILFHSPNLLITKWDVLKPREDIARGFSAYHIDKGIKVSKIYDKNNQLVYWYCDIIKTTYDKENNSYIFCDLLIDVLVFPDNHVEILDIDEFADILEHDSLCKELSLYALRSADALLKDIYANKFSTYTQCINDMEKEITR